jgi:YVTN family beta-propeller protein
MRLAWMLLALSTAGASDRAAFAVVEKVAGAVGFYTEDGRQAGRVPVGNFPHEAILSPDGRTIYVSVNGVLWMTEDAQGSNTIAVVDARSMRKIADIDLGRFHRPHGLALLDDGTVLATTERPFGLIRVDPRQRRVIRDYDVHGKSPHMVIPLPGADRVFVSDTDSDCVAEIQLASGDVRTIPTGGGRPQGAVLSPDRKLLYVVNTNGNSIAIIDTAKGAVVGSIATGKGPGRIAMTPDGRTLVYNLQFEPAVGFADVATGKQIAMAPVEGRPLSLTMTRDGKRAFAGLQEQDKVVIVDVPGRGIARVLALPKGSGPDVVLALP